MEHTPPQVSLAAAHSPCRGRQGDQPRKRWGGPQTAPVARLCIPMPQVHGRVACQRPLPTISASNDGSVIALHVSA